MKEIHVESPFLCDYVSSRNGCSKHVRASTPESKPVLKITNCTKNEDDRAM